MFIFILLIITKFSQMINRNIITGKTGIGKIEHLFETSFILYKQTAYFPTTITKSKLFNVVYPSCNMIKILINICYI